VVGYSPSYHACGRLCPATPPPDRRRGFANRQLLAALGIALLLGLVLLAQDGSAGRGIAGLLVGGNIAQSTNKPSKSKAAAKGKGKSAATPAAPPLYPAPASRLSAAIPRIEERRATLWRAEKWRDARARRGLAHMDEDAAAALLQKMPDPDAAGMLRGLDEFALGRILDAAPPDKGAAWLRLLTAEHPRPPLAPELLPPNAVFGSEVAFEDLLRQYGFGPEGQLLNPAAAADPSVTSAQPPGANQPGGTPSGNTAGAGSASPAAPGSNPPAGATGAPGASA
jgi:hypothetical protein